MWEKPLNRYIFQQQIVIRAVKPKWSAFKEYKQKRDKLYCVFKCYRHNSVYFKKKVVSLFSKFSMHKVELIQLCVVTLL